MLKEFAMRNTILTLAAFMLLVCSASLVEAGEFFITDSAGIEQSSFAFDETPWLSITLKAQEKEVIGGWWKEIPGGAQNPISKSGLVGGQSYLWAFTDWGWPIPQTEGTYQAHVNGYGTERTFTVTPEPISSVLFLIGAAALTGAGIKRRKKS